MGREHIGTKELINYIGDPCSCLSHYSLSSNDSLREGGFDGWMLLSRLTRSNVICLLYPPSVILVYYTKAVQHSPLVFISYHELWIGRWEPSLVCTSTINACRPHRRGDTRSWFPPLTLVLQAGEMPSSSP